MSEQSGITRATPQVAVPSVVWGVIVLLIAGIAFAGSVVDLREVSGVGIVWIVIGVGVLLVIAAVIGALIRAVGPRSEPAQNTESTTDTADATSTDRLTDL